eukprot:6193371-Pleurochrysis_carterae.AAC.1
MAVRSIRGCTSLPSIPHRDTTEVLAVRPVSPCCTRDASRVARFRKPADTKSLLPSRSLQPRQGEAAGRSGGAEWEGGVCGKRG